MTWAAGWPVEWSEERKHTYGERERERERERGEEKGRGTGSSPELEGKGVKD